MSTNLLPPEGVPLETWLRLAKADGLRWAIDERNADGEVVGTAYRLPNGDKDFKKGGKRGLILAWPLPTYAGAIEADPILVCEGASDTAAMLGLGFDSVGVPMTGHCGKMLAAMLASLHVVLVADADKAGRDGANKIAAELVKRCASVKVIEPPGGHKDAREAVIAGHKREDFEALIAKADAIRPKAAPVNGEPVIVRLSDVEPREVNWLWEERIPRGRLTLLVGRPGEGKSMATMDWAARVTTGRAWPDGSPCALGSVVLVAGEDDPGDTIRPRLDAHGADATRVHLLRAVTRLGAKGAPIEAAFTLADIDALERTLATVPDCSLVIVDPIGSFIGGKVDAHRDNEVRGVLAPLAALAERTSAAVLLVAHQRKGAASHADDMVLGSRAFTGIARSVLHLLMDPGDDERRLLLPGKANLSRPAPGLAFTITGKPPRIEWEPDPVAMTANGVLAAQAGGDTGGHTERDDAANWLRDFLSDGPKLARDVLSEAKAAGFSKRTIDRAKSGAGVRTRKEAFSGGWVWALAEPNAPPGEGCQACQPDAEDCHTPTSGNLREKPDESCGVGSKVANLQRVATFDGAGGSLGNLGDDGANAGEGTPASAATAEQGASPRRSPCQDRLDQLRAERGIKPGSVATIQPVASGPVDPATDPLAASIVAKAEQRKRQAIDEALGIERGRSARTRA